MSDERRVIARDDETFADATWDIRWRGTVEKPDGQTETRHVWKQPTIEQVIGKMNQDLGTWDESQYTVRE